MDLAKRGFEEAVQKGVVRASNVPASATSSHACFEGHRESCNAEDVCVDCEMYLMSAASLHAGIDSQCQVCSEEGGACWCCTAQGDGHRCVMPTVLLVQQVMMYLV